MWQLRGSPVGSSCWVSAGHTALCLAVVPSIFERLLGEEKSLDRYSGSWHLGLKHWEVPTLHPCGDDLSLSQIACTSLLNPTCNSQINWLYSVGEWRPGLVFVFLTSYQGNTDLGCDTWCVRRAEMPGRLLAVRHLSPPPLRIRPGVPAGLWPGIWPLTNWLTFVSSIRFSWTWWEGCFTAAISLFLG